MQSLWKTAWGFLRKLKIELPYHTAMALLGIYTKDAKIQIQRSTCIPMFVAALSTIAKLWTEPKCPLSDEWIKKMWYIYIMEFYSVFKKNEILSFVTMRTELENIALNKISQRKTNTM